MTTFRPLRIAATEPRVVLTGFGAFPNVTRNATAEIIAAIAEDSGIALRAQSFRARDFVMGRGVVRLSPGTHVHASLLVLPVSWEAAPRIAIAEARAARASLLLMSGVAAPAQPIFVERGSTGARTMMRDAFGARPRRARRQTYAVSIDTERATSAAELALANEATLESVVPGVVLGEVRAENAYVCNATTHGVATARLRGTRHGFIHWPRDIAAHDVPACARVLLAIAAALTRSPVASAG